MEKIIMREIKSFHFEVVMNCKPNEPENDFITTQNKPDGMTSALHIHRLKD